MNVVRVDFVLVIRRRGGAVARTTFIDSRVGYHRGKKQRQKISAQKQLKPFECLIKVVLRNIRVGWAQPFIIKLLIFKDF